MITSPEPSSVRALEVELARIDRSIATETKRHDNMIKNLDVRRKKTVEDIVTLKKAEIARLEGK